MSEPLDTSAVAQRRCPMPLEAALQLIDAAEFAVLSTVDEAGNPYGVPVSVVRDPESAADAPLLYFHTTPFAGSRKALNMGANPRVSLVFVGRAETLGSKYTVDYESVVAAGTAQKLSEPARIKRTVDLLLARFAPMCSAEENAAYIAASKNYLPALWCVKVERLTGKRHPAAA